MLYSDILRRFPHIFEEAKKLSGFNYGGWIYIIHSSDIHIKSSIVTNVAQTVSKNVFIRMKTFTKTSRVFLIFLICTVFSLIWRDNKCTLGWRMLIVWYIWPPRDPRKIMFLSNRSNTFQTPFTWKISAFYILQIELLKEEEKLWKPCFREFYLLCFCSEIVVGVKPQWRRNKTLTFWVLSRCSCS